MEIVSFFRKHPVFTLSFIYFLFRIPYLTILPIFNDEAIYLDWGWRMTHEPGYLYYSLYDGKQPFLMWFFGIFQTILADPLFAGRLVSIFSGWLCLYGIYKISETYFSRRVTILSLLLYIVIPIYSFYDRQALMESAIGAVGVWTAWYLIRLVDKQYLKDAVKLGIVLGVGIFIKFSAIIFLIAVFLLGIYFYFKKKFPLTFFSIISGAFLLSVLLLLIQPQFWKSLSMNSRYGNTFSELVQVPALLWIQNIISNIEILFIHLTPIVCIAAFLGILFLLKYGTFPRRLLAVWICINLILQILLIKETVPRYIVSYLPLFTITTGFFLTTIKLSHFLKYALYLLVFLLPLLFTIVQITNPPLYFSMMSKVTRFSDISYISGAVSGYGIDELVQKIIKLQRAENRPIIIGIAANAGIPESALVTYFQKNKLIHVVYFEESIFNDLSSEYDCLNVEEKVFFISRGTQTPGIDTFLIYIETMTNSYNQNTFGIWKLNETCTGSTLPLSIEKI